MASGAVTKRLQSELMGLMMEPVPGVTAFPDGDSLNTWTGTLTPDGDSVYTGCAFKLGLSFPGNYPLVPPSVRFVTRVWHPNVDYPSGAICLDLLKDAWSPSFSSFLGGRRVPSVFLPFFVLHMPLCAELVTCADAVPRWSFPVYVPSRVSVERSTLGGWGRRELAGAACCRGLPAVKASCPLPRLPPAAAMSPLLSLPLPPPFPAACR